MPMNLLEEIADGDIPYTTTDAGEIDKLKILQRAGHVLCHLPRRDGEGLRTAIVYEVTVLGRRMLQKFGPSVARHEALRIAAGQTEIRAP